MGVPGHSGTLALNKSRCPSPQSYPALNIHICTKATGLDTLAQNGAALSVGRETACQQRTVRGRRSQCSSGRCWQCLGVGEKHGREAAIPSERVRERRPSCRASHSQEAPAS